jgi:hypothetical protein
MFKKPTTEPTLFDSLWSVEVLPILSTEKRRQFAREADDAVAKAGLFEKAEIRAFVDRVLKTKQEAIELSPRDYRELLKRNVR